MLWKETAIANLDISDLGWLALRDILLFITVYVDCEYPYKGLYIKIISGLYILDITRCICK